MDSNNKPQDIGNSKAMGEIVRYLKNYPFLLITVAGMLILVGILVFDIEKLKEFKWLIYGVVLVPIGFQFMLEFKKQGVRREAGEASGKLDKTVETSVISAPVSFSRKAIISLVLFGIYLLAIGSEKEEVLRDVDFQIGVLILLAIPALFLGFFALNDTKRGAVKGRGLAITALGLSVFMIISSLGWMGQGGKQTTEHSSLVSPPLPVVPEKTVDNPQPFEPPQSAQTSQSAIAVRCMTQSGWCPMMVAIPVGSSCSCTTAYGVILGVSQ